MCGKQLRRKDLQRHLLLAQMHKASASISRHIRKRQRSDDEDQQQVHDDVQQRSQNYAFMLHNLMVMIQEYLLLSDDNKQRGALKSLDLVRSTAELREDNRICIWLEDV